MNRYALRQLDKIWTTICQTGRAVRKSLCLWQEFSAGLGDVLKCQENIWAAVPWCEERPWCLPLLRGNFWAALEQPSSRDSIPCLGCPSGGYEGGDQDKSCWAVLKVPLWRLGRALGCLWGGFYLQGHCNSQLESRGPLGSLKWGVSADTREWCCVSEATGVEHSAACAPQPRVCIARQGCTRSCGQEWVASREAASEGAEVLFNPNPSSQERINSTLLNAALFSSWPSFMGTPRGQLG